MSWQIFTPMMIFLTTVFVWVDCLQFKLRNDICLLFMKSLADRFVGEKRAFYAKFLLKTKVQIMLQHRKIVKYSRNTVK